ncbi:polysaccharide deacetylase family protein [Patescibacteria group bacterium]|nr:polysaccharide deacetylase family protein [Patescibacteria group bacterium]
MKKYCFIQIDMDDNQWVFPRQRGKLYNIYQCDNYLKAIDNIKKHLGTYPITLFIVGLDMRAEKKVSKLLELIDTCPNIEIANHSLSHFNDIKRISYDDKRREITESDGAIRSALGIRKIYGYRNHGYVFCNDVINILQDNGYLYDSSFLPSYFGPVLRTLNYLINGVPGRDNFGHFKNGFSPNEPILLDKNKAFYEINVSVCPVLRIPIHYSLVKSTAFYHILSNLIAKITYLNFIFHLDDFINVDIMKLNYVLNLISSHREIVLSKDIGMYYNV